VRGLDDWLSVARSASPEDLREHIPSPIDSVLDFGCGVGRSFPYLKSLARHVVGFDLPPMIARCRSLATESVDLLLDDWDAARRRHFDLIAATLVLQHIEPASCRAYLADSAQMAPAVYVLTRVENDFGENVLELVAQTGLFDTGECVKVDAGGPAARPRFHMTRALRFAAALLLFVWPCRAPCGDWPARTAYDREP